MSTVQHARQIATPSRFALLIYGKTPPIAAAAAAAAAAGLIRASHQLSPDSISSSDESGMSHVPCVNHLLACFSCLQEGSGGASASFEGNIQEVHQEPSDPPTTNHLSRLTLHRLSTQAEYQTRWSRPVLVLYGDIHPGHAPAYIDGYISIKVS